MLAACGEHFSIDSTKVDALLKRIRGGSRENPFIYALHFKLLDAIQNDHLDEIELLISGILDQAPAGPGILVTSLHPDDFPWDADVVSGYFADEPDSIFAYVAPAGRVEPRSAQVRDALEMIRRGSPGLADEIDELVTTVILATGIHLNNSTTPAAPFQGASALRAFGSIVLDAEPDLSPVDAITSMIHEQAHLVLFALAPKDGVVTNPDEERYASPLRDDLRPLEGIHHATFVLARMIFGLQSVRSTIGMSPYDESRISEIVNTSRPLFYDGLETLSRHANLTPEGAFTLDAAKAYMETAFS